MQILTNANYNFIRWKWHAITLSLAVIIAGAVMIAMRGLPLGIDFSGGTLVVVQFEQAVTEQQVRDAVSSLPGDEVVQQYGPAADRRILVRLPQPEGGTQSGTLEQASMQGIREWARRNPERLNALLDENPSYVFFRILPPNAPGAPDGPLGALGVPLSAGRSVKSDDADRAEIDIHALCIGSRRR